MICLIEMELWLMKMAISILGNRKITINMVKELWSIQMAANMKVNGRRTTDIEKVLCSTQTES
jgi:hypothetical protein